MRTLQQLVHAQIWQYHFSCKPNKPEWYEIRRKTVHIIFWS